MPHGNRRHWGLPLAEPIETKRRLAAIFAADVEGYSRLMGADEVATLDALTARREILDGLIATHGGRIANTAGDSVLAEFGSAVDAVRCAMEAQGALAKANSSFPENRPDVAGPVSHSNAPIKPKSQSILSKIVAHFLNHFDPESL